MDENKLNAVRKYLTIEFPGDEVEEDYDSDLAAQTFKIHYKNNELLLKVYKNFLSDNNEKEITTILINQKISNLLKETKELGVSVGNSGVHDLNSFV